MSDLTIQTNGRGLVDVTARLNDFLQARRAQHGALLVFIKHTSASIVVTENADPDVLEDLETWMASAVLDGDRRFLHTAEGPDDMASHIRSVLTQTSLTLPVTNGALELGTWQGIYVWEHRSRSHTRRLSLRYLPCP
ncbi:MAG: hypothetical protein DHS20C11_08810 [Lysobacteraceae bacterium]|nr:MAG: hypothetical protein DHS20C11_08810 [Xanthomonadaceae bacterium]